MIYLRNDYCGICHYKILEALNENINNVYNGYGLDENSKKAEELIIKKIGNPLSKVYFLAGGTSCNKIFIGHALRPYEAVIAADSGHINVHETGAIEGAGHKIIAVKNKNGKITSEDIVDVIKNHTDEHMVKPKMVYISFPTEYGTLYSLEELKRIKEECEKNDLYLYIDGARLGSGLSAYNNDITMNDLAKYSDAFYIGGTKNGLLFGEAIVINNESLQKDFRYSIKHFGGMLAKGFVTGLMFEKLFADDLFLKIGKKQNELAKLITERLSSLNIKLLIETETNQIFPIFKTEVIEKLREEISFEIWEKKEEETVIRFVTHYMLTEDDVNNLEKVLKKII